MREESAGQLDIGIIAEPTAAHLDFYLETIAACRGIGAIAYAAAGGAVSPSLPEAVHAGAMQRYNTPEAMLRDFRPQLAIVLVEPAQAPQWISAALQAGCHVL
ncbi:MAG: hypothetical protein ABIZ80_07000, partial [Bryobacteraceae bacterium]